MENESSAPKKREPIVFEADGMCLRVDHRRGVGGDDGVTFDVTVAGDEAGARILRFDCFGKTPYYHIGPAGKDAVHDMIAEGIADPVRWTLDPLKSRLNALLTQAGYEEIAKRIDQKAIADSLSQVEPDIFAKV